jgi:hypothetical protein
MRYFLQYHNIDKLGWVPLDEQPFLQTQLAIATRRPSVRKAVGGTVFLIASLGKPRRYFLWECFRVEAVEPEGADLCAHGTGWQLVPPQPLEGPAFEEFRKSCAYFIGFRGIDDLPYHATLVDLAGRFHRDAVNDDAERFCTMLIDRLPGNADVHFYRGFVRHRLGRSADALADLEEALRRPGEFLDEARTLVRAARLDLPFNGRTGEVSHS